MQYNFSNILLILDIKYFYNQLRFKVVIDKNYKGGDFFPDTVYSLYAPVGMHEEIMMWQLKK